jgi:starch synthase
MAHLWERLWRNGEAARDASSRVASRVLFVTSELAPLVKTGGLADVSFALPAALGRLGCDVRVLLPAYRAVWSAVGQPRAVLRGDVDGRHVRVLEAQLAGGVTAWLLDCPALYDRPGNPYQDEFGRDFPDNAERFAFLARVTDWLVEAAPAFVPDVVHLNDWPTALAAPWIGTRDARPRVLFSVHNLEYQGLFDRSTFDRLGLPPGWWAPEALEYYDRFSFMKAGLVFADAITTVSPSYAREIRTPEHGFGLDGLLRHRALRTHGILNGIDATVWNPATDPHLPQRYDASDLGGKAQCRAALEARLGLVADDTPLAGIVSRFVPQKGIDLVLAAIDRLVEMPLKLAVLGSGAAALEAGFAAAVARYPGRVAHARGFDEPLAHLIEAGADLFLMPSRFEPCGLNQMYSMRYGTVPVVRRTGGLADTVTDAGSDAAGTGFLFEAASAEGLIDAVARALDARRDAARWREIQRNGMTRDFSWSSSATRYLELYATLRAEA